MSDSKLESLRQTLGEPAKDLKLNISNVLANSTLDEPQRFTVALASALFLKEFEIAGALMEIAGDKLSEMHVDDALAAASIMAMNTVYYRFRHSIGKETYQQMRAGFPGLCLAEGPVAGVAGGPLSGCDPVGELQHVGQPVR